MFTILLVDDEPLVRHDLRTLMDYHAYGFEIIGEAQNAETALAFLEETQPDVAIIDINMPGMNGMELNRAIKQQYPAVKTVILSSYDDYDYVRDCLKNGSIDYLLKHRLDADTLRGLLEKAVVEEDESASAQARTTAAVASQELALYRSELYRERMVDMIRGKESAVEEWQRLTQSYEMFPNAALYAVAVLQIVPFLLLTELNTDVQTNRLVQQAVELMQQSFGTAQDRMVAYVEEGRIIVVFSFTERSEHTAASEVARWMSKLSHALEMYLNIKSICQAGHICTKLSQLKASYDAAESQLDTTGASDDFQTDSSQRGQTLALTIEEQRQLLLAIERLDPAAVAQLITSVFDRMRSWPLHAYRVQRIISELLHIGDKALKKEGLLFSERTEAEQLPARGELARLGSMLEIEQWVQDFYHALLVMRKERYATGTYSRHVSQAISFILEHYSGLVTLELAAGMIGLNASYLSRIFKEETGLTFSEYINRVRVDAACRLMESGKYSMKQVSDQAGFSTHNYFFKVFKEVKKMTPQSYIQSQGGNQA